MLVTECIGAHTAGGTRAPAHILVHAAGCRDIARVIGGDAYTEEYDSVQDVVEETYGPQAGSFYAENGIPEAEWGTAWKDHGYVDDFHFYPCTDGLPYDRPE